MKMRKPKELALAAILDSLRKLEVQVTPELKNLIEDLVNLQWEGRNKDRDSTKDEAELLKLIRDYVARNPSSEDDK
jgi:hypothetical protein